MQKWEYKVVHGPSQSELNQLGAEGWELVSVIADVSGDAYSTSSSIKAYLKRPLPN
jgi:hypothetical protein